MVREGASALLVECSYTEVLPDLGRDLTGLVITDFDLVIRDTDLDGIPDEFQRRPLVISGVETLLDNGYLAIRDSDDHVQILELWDGVIGAATMELLKRTRGPDSRPTRRE